MLVIVFLSFWTLFTAWLVKRAFFTAPKVDTRTKDQKAHDIFELASDGKITPAEAIRRIHSL